MKTVQQITEAIEKLTADLKAIQSRKDDLDDWAKAGQGGRNEEFFVAQIKEREHLEKEEWKAEYRIRAYKWVLE